MSIKTLIYLPLERYDSRYTEYQSGFGGVFHSQVEASRRCNIVILEPHNDLMHINHGSVVDYVLRSHWSFWQMQKLLAMVADGTVTDDTVIYFEDFWTPGFEMLPYACHIAGVRPKVYATNYSQSFDEFDFTYPMRDWMRPIEQGWLRWLSGIFVACDDHKDKICAALPSDSYQKVHSVGLMMSREHLLHIYPGVDLSSTNNNKVSLRDKSVIFASRYDDCKNPNFFVDLAAAFKRTYPEIGAHFYFIGPDKPKVQNIGQVSVFDLQKKDYYRILSRASVSFNCASHDFVSYTLLEALIFGATPLYTDFRPSFVATLRNNPDYLYKHLNLLDACSKLYSILSQPSAPVLCSTDPPTDLYLKYGKVYDDTTFRMLDVMLGEPTLTALLTI